MRVGLIDVDSHNFPNLALMKISAHHKMRELDYDPYVMIYNKPNAPKITRQIQRWVNSKWVWRSVERFEDYGGNK